MVSEIPTAMSYVRLEAYGPPAGLVRDTAPVPVPGAGEVLIRVAAAGVNRPDVLQRQGLYPPPPGVSDVLGLEVAGEVVDAGPGVTRWRAGDRVCALVAAGGYAEYAVAPEPQCMAVPKGLSLLDAACLPENYLTVWTNVFERGHLRSGESLLVHGGSSGIGTTAIQLAVARGITVFATAGTAGKCAACENLGATAINYREQVFEDEIARLTEGRGVDVILDLMGGSYVARNLKALADDGRLVQIAWLDTSKISADFRELMTRRLTWTGSTLRPRPIEEKGRIARAVEENAWPLLESGAVKVLVHATFPLAEAAAAHALMEQSSHIGKIALVADERLAAEKQA